MNPTQFQQATGTGAELAARWCPSINVAMTFFNISHPLQQAQFIAQIGHESAGFTQLSENFNYTPTALMSTFGKRISDYQAQMLGRTSEHPARQVAIANLVYAGRMGNKSSNDGWKYRGRGLIQITGLNNYLACGEALHIDLVAEPEKLECDNYAALSAAWFFTHNGCLAYAENTKRVTRLINPALQGLADRLQRFNQAKAALA
ncbi:putative chitinase [Paramixta manurensis]|uniref:Putative chitinase n=1 Tax=Paramixta manurensis TaxID=2740817 RepID=A0A6M8U7J3_9GAMM|nr:putative chitinase [Erwiniaceae bacterium PD-1]